MSNGQAGEDAPGRSPVIFDPRTAGPNVRRLNRFPLALGGGLVLALLCAVLYTVHQRGQEVRRKAAEEREPREDAESATPVIVPPPRGLGLGPGPANMSSRDTGKMSGEDPERQRDLEDARRSRELEKAAREAPTTAGNDVAKSEPPKRESLQGGPTGGLPRARGVAGPGVGGVTGATGGGGAGLPLDMLRPASQNGGDEMAHGEEAKNGYLNGMEATEPTLDHYLKTSRVPAIAPAQEVKQGTVIPGILIGGINSDLPGQLLGQVSENVYDTATGSHLLIPQGSKLVGRYDSRITWGQERVLVAWTRIIYPDSSSLDLGGMPGTDEAGYAGMTGDVNNHLWRIFGHAVLLGFLSAGIQLSQPQQNSSGNFSAQSLVAASLGQQMGEVGMALVRRNLMIPPTIEVANGARFQVQCTKDIILPTWKG